MQPTSASRSYSGRIDQGTQRRGAASPPPPSASARHAPPSQRQSRPQNVPGPFYVDQTCIDCDTCRWMAPSIFTHVEGASAVTAQPSTPDQRRLALEALVSCPTYSIHTTALEPGEMGAVVASFPLQILGTSSVYHMGYHDEASYGAASYLIVRQAGGQPENIMIDVPRWAPKLAQQITEKFGGVQKMFMTHRDDVGAHAKWAEHFGCGCIIHELEANSRQGTDAVEWKLQGEGPWQLGPDIDLLFTPGHTAGCVCLLFKPEKVLFSGDHLAYSHRLERMTMFKRYNWHSVPKQLASVTKLVDVDFLHVLPGHGRRYSFASDQDRRQQLQDLVEVESKS